MVPSLRGFVPNYEEAQRRGWAGALRERKG